MITAGVISVAIGLVLGFAGFGLHLRNMKNMIDGDDSKLSGGVLISPFIFIGAGGLASLIGGVIAIVGTILYFT